jgi:hypothetical protein
MTPILQQLLTMLGVLLGAGATFAATASRDRATWRRSQRVRWDEKRLQTYAEYANSVKSLIQASLRLAATQGFPSNAHPIDKEEGLAALAEAETDRAQKWETVLLLGDPDTIAAARSWHEYAWKLDWFARGKLTGDNEYLQTRLAADSARSRFYACARKDLGMPVPDVPGAGTLISGRGELHGEGGDGEGERQHGGG